MSADPDPSSIIATQKLLSKYVKKPPLTEKLLLKPPFRFLHDVITTIIKETGFLDGLYTADELDSTKIKDKETKIAFLDKLLFAVKLASKEKLTARSSKIVAGLEVNKTLDLLQAIGRCLDSKVDTTAVVEKIVKKDVGKVSKTKEENAIQNDKLRRDIENLSKLDQQAQKNQNDETKLVTKKKEIKNEQVSTKRKEKESQLTNEQRQEKNDKNLNNKGNIKVNREVISNNKNITSQSKKPSSQEVIDNNLQKKTKSTEKNIKPVDKNVSKGNPAADIKKKGSSKIQHQNLKNETQSNDEKLSSNDKNLKSTKKAKYDSENSKIPKPGDPNNYSVNGTLSELPKITSKFEDIVETSSDKLNINSEDEILKNTIRQDNAHKSKSSPRPLSARPHSRSRRRSEQISSSVDVAHEAVELSRTNSNDLSKRSASVVRPNTANRPPSARPGAPRIRDRGEVSVADEEKRSPVVVNVIEEGNADLQLDDKESMVIVESMASVETYSVDEIAANGDRGHLVNQILKTQNEFEESSGTLQRAKGVDIEWKAGKQRERETVAKEIQALCSSIQTLTGAANPLGKLIDYLKEDVDEIFRELEYWRKVNAELRMKQDMESESSRLSLEPLQKQLEEAEFNIQIERQQLSNLKSVILANDERIFKLAANINSNLSTKVAITSRSIKS